MRVSWLPGRVFPVTRGRRSPPRPARRSARTSGSGRRRRRPAWSASARRRRCAPAARSAAGATVSGEPIACPSRRCRTNSPLDLGVRVRRRLLRAWPAAPAGPARSRRNDSAAGPASHSARSSVSAQTALTATIAYGLSSHCDGRKFCRYSASAGRVFAELKWWANENGRPSRPASWALKPLDPSSQIAGCSPRPGVAVIGPGCRRLK